MASLLEKHVDSFHGNNASAGGGGAGGSPLGNLLGSLLQSADAPPDVGQGQSRGTGVLSILGSALKGDAEGLESAAGPIKSVKTTDPITGKPVEVRMRGANYAGHVGGDGKLVKNFSDVAHLDEFQTEGEKTRRKDVQKDVNEQWKKALSDADLSIEEQKALSGHFGNIKELTRLIQSLPPEKQKYILEAQQRQTTAQEQISVAQAIDKAVESGKIDGATLQRAVNAGFKLPAGLWSGSGKIDSGTSITLSDSQRTALSSSSGTVKSNAETVVKNQDNEFSRAANEAGIGKQYEAYKTSANVLGSKGVNLTNPLLNQEQTLKEIGIAEGNVERRAAEGRYLIDFKNQNPNTRVGAGAVRQQFSNNYTTGKPTVDDETGLPLEPQASTPAQANAPVAPPAQQAAAPASQPAKTSPSGARVPPRPAAPAVGGDQNQGNEGRRIASTTPVANTGGGAAVFYPKPGGRKPPQGAPTNTNLSLDKLLNSLAGQKYANGGVIRAANGIGPILPTDPRFKDPALAMMDNTDGIGSKIAKGFAASMGIPPDIASSIGKSVLGEDNYNYAQGFKADPYSYLKESLRAKPDVSPYDNLGGYARGGVIRAADGAPPVQRVGTAAVGKVDLPEYAVSRDRSEAMLPPNEVYNAPKVSRPSQIAGLFNPIDYEIQAQRYKRQEAPDLYGTYAPGRSVDIAGVGAEEGFHEARHTPIVDNYIRAVDAHQSAASAANQSAQARFYGQKADIEGEDSAFKDWLITPDALQFESMAGYKPSKDDWKRMTSQQTYARGGIIRAAEGAGPVIPPEMAQATPAFLQQIQAASPVPPPGPAQAGLGQVQNAGQNEQLKAMAADQKMRQNDAGFIDKKEQEWDSAEQKIRHAEEMHALKKWKVLKEAGVDVNYESLLKEAQKIASGKLLLDEVKSNNDEMTQANQGASLEDTIANIQRNNNQNTQTYQKAYNGYSHGGVERGYEAGSMGVIDGPGTTKSDSIPARLSVGEVVLPAEDVMAIGEGNPELGYKRLKDYARSFGSNQKAQLADGGMLNGNHYANGGRVGGGSLYDLVMGAYENGG